MHYRMTFPLAGLLMTGLLFGCSSGTNNAANPASVVPPVPVQETNGGTTLGDGVALTDEALAVAPPKHVMTGDYFDSPWGTRTVAPSRALPYLNYVRTAAANGTALHDAGFRVQVYTDPNRLAVQDPLYAASNPSGISKTCRSEKVYDEYAGRAQYVGQPNTTILKSAYATLIESEEDLGHIDQVFMDNTGALTDFGIKYYPSLPCSYTDVAWIDEEKEIADASPLPVIFNGLSGLHNEGLSLSIGVLAASKVAGGEYEHCFSDNSRAEQGSWPWVDTENTQLLVVSKLKQFHCQAVNTAAASSAHAARIYTIASFLMTYNPNYSILWEGFGTPSGLHVMPESGLIALNPAVHPTSVAELKQSGGSYVRVYNSCYYRGTLIGQCAMAVNPDYYSHPVVLAGFHHTLALIGSGVLDGGTVSYYGAAPPSTLAAESAVVALP